MVKKNQDLVNQYVSLYREKEILDQKLVQLKEKLAAYSESVNQKVFTSGNYLLRISWKLKILFPKKNQKDRKEILALVKQFPEYQKVLSFDIVKLADLYKKKQISQELRKKITRFATQKKVFRFSLQKKDQP